MISAEPSDSKTNTPHSTAPPIVLAFHKLASQVSFGVTNYSPRRFRRLMDYLRNSDYHLCQSLTPAPTGQPQHLMISFDDGYQHLAGWLPQLMKQYNFKPLVFMPTAWIGKSNRWDYSHLFRSVPHLDRRSIQDLARIGVQFGSHGHSHVDLTSCDEPKLIRELTESKDILEQLTGQDITTISYPFGRCNRRVRLAVAEAGYDFGFTMDFPTDRDDIPLAHGRIAIYGYDTCFSINQKIRRGRFYHLEHLKARITNKLSGGTVILNRWRGQNNL